MSLESPSRLAPAVVPAVRIAPRVVPWLRFVAIVLAGSAFVAACAHVAVPLYFTPVPLTLQPFAVLLLGLLLTPRLAAATLGAYLLEGAVGLPVFSPGLAGVSGLAHLLGPTGGYLLVYPAAAFLIAAFWRRTRRDFPSALAAAAAGNLVILIGGAVWLAILTHTSARTVLSESILPFLPGDALKVAAAAALAAGGRRWRQRNSPS